MELRSFRTVLRECSGIGSCLFFLLFFLVGAVFGFIPALLCVQRCGSSLRQYCLLLCDTALMPFRLLLTVLRLPITMMIGALIGRRRLSLAVSIFCRGFCFCFCCSVFCLCALPFGLLRVFLLFGYEILLLPPQILLCGAFLRKSREAPVFLLCFFYAALTAILVWRSAMLLPLIPQ